MALISTAPITPSQLASTSPAEFARHLAGEPEHAALWIRAAAEQGMPDAQALMGQILLDGRGVAEDAAQARNWFAKAAAQSHLMGMNMLGRCLELGWGGPADVATAATWFRQAAEAGLDWGMYNYANLLLHGNGVDKDEARALAWYRQGAALGNAKCLNVVGRFYEEGWLVQIDKSAALDYYRQGAEGGDFRGQYNYALMLAEQGDMPTAIHWLEQALQGAHLRFSRTMASTLLTYPHPDFHRIALLAHEKCCQAGEADDFYAYGMALLNQPSQAANQVLAHTWLMRAAGKGHQQARAQLANLSPG